MKLILIPKYLKISKTYELNKKITHFIITTGPGSYTALRVGASFIAGLSQSMSLPVAIISTENNLLFVLLQNFKNNEVDIPDVDETKETSVPDEKPNEITLNVEWID